ncbi:MAG TPA: FtsQ-type POTRA domain-containing protein [Halanaerobiales bacterium]|nr:FtsQ-type POTRA domain-containing protein [Halanaerobiales bacterium]
MSQDKLLFLLVTIISLIALVSFCLSPFFHIQEINFNGLYLLSAEQLNNQMKLYSNHNIFILDRLSLEKELTANSYIQNVRVIKKYPNKLNIEIRERRPIACINNNGQYIIFSADGFILEPFIKARKTVPEIKGAGYFLKSNRIQFTPELKNVVEGLKSIDRTIVAMLTRIELKTDGEIRVYANELPIIMGSDNNLKEKFRILHSVFNESSFDTKIYEYIDLSITKKPVIKLKTQ